MAKQCDYCPQPAACVLPFPDMNSPALCAWHKAKLLPSYETRELTGRWWNECHTGQFPEAKLLFKEER